MISSFLKQKPRIFGQTIEIQENPAPFLSRDIDKIGLITGRRPPAIQRPRHHRPPPDVQEGSAGHGGEGHGKGFDGEDAQVCQRGHGDG